MNRLLSCLLALIFLFACTGCGSAASRPSTEAEDLTVQSGADPAGDKEPIALEPPAEAEIEAPEEAPDAAGQPEDAPEAETAPEEPYVRVIDPAGPMVALTFDDGPHAVYTDQLLDILEEHHAVATFFEVGVNVARYPEAVARAAALGCEIGSHSNAHKDLSKLKKAALLADLDAADQAIAAAAGQAPALLRPPYGAVNKTVKYATGRSVITWTVDTQDWLTKDAQKIIECFQSQESLDGEIVLLHSTYETTVEAMKTVVPWLIEKGYQLVTVSELMAYYYGELLQPDQFYGYTYFTTHGRTNTPLRLPAEEAAPEEPAETEPPAETPPALQQPAAQPEETNPVQSTQPPARTQPEGPSAEPPAAAQADPSEEGPVLPAEESPAAGQAPELPPAEDIQEAEAESQPPAEEAPPSIDTEPPGWL